MGIQWQGESASLVYLLFQDEGRVEEVPRQKIISAPLPFDCGGSDSHLVCSSISSPESAVVLERSLYSITDKGICGQFLAEHFEH